MSPDPWVGLEYCSHAHCLILWTPVEPKRSKDGMTLTSKRGVEGRGKPPNSPRVMEVPGFHVFPLGRIKTLLLLQMVNKVIESLELGMNRQPVSLPKRKECN